MTFFDELLAWIKEEQPDKRRLGQQKVLLCKRHGLRRIPTDIAILMHATKEDLPAVKQFLTTKPMRTGSGVAVVATMTAPFSCPHGSCTYCPGGIGSVFGDTPQSYTGKEPSTMRGIRHDYDPYRIIFNRLEQYLVMGQNPDKVEQVIMGGTFPSFPTAYQEEFIRSSFQAYNDFSRTFFSDGEFDLDHFKEFFELPGEVGDPGRAARITQRVLSLKRQSERSLEEEQVLNETATIRCVGLTVETRPDYGFKEQGLALLRLGVTRIELGVQTTSDELLRATQRGHTIADTVRSIAELRDLGFKLNFHIMPGLPGIDGRKVGKEQDIASLHELFSNPDYRPDMLKVYPCMVMPGTALEQQYKEGLFKPLSTGDAASIIVGLKKCVPEWCRIMRIQRDIPTQATTAGVNITNLRQAVQRLAEQQGVHCRCIRCREIGRATVKEEPQIVIREYDASHGKEFFISLETDDKVLGFLRLRLPSRSLHPVITPSAALVRELHVYGPAVAIGAAAGEEAQHKGYGKQLLAAAEAIAKKQGRDKMVVISGVGVRGYYRKRGYRREEFYMTREL